MPERPAPALSIVVPVLNEAVGIAATLQALVPLRERGAEVIVVDGGSTDDSPRRAAPWADRVLSGPRGRARQMNSGAAAARAPLLLFLHADTQLPEGADALLHDAVAGGASWGRFDVHIDGRAPCCGWWPR